MNIFDFDEKEQKAIDKFKIVHQDCIEDNKGRAYVDTYFQYIFTETSIGLYKEIKCPFCNSKEDVTNIDVF